MQIADPNNINLDRKWCIWFHKLDDDNWDNKSYRQVYKFSTISGYWKLFNNLPSINTSMLFLMKDNVFPTYEDPENIIGGSWSYRVLRKDLSQAWEELCMSIVGETLNEENHIINGVSVNPKNCVIKIWINSIPEENYLKFITPIVGVDDTRAIFTSHVEKSNNSKYKKL